jgi:hypothetical protein
MSEACHSWSFSSCAAFAIFGSALRIFWPNEIVAGTVTDIRLAALSHTRALLPDDYRAFDDVTDSRR